MEIESTHLGVEIHDGVGFSVRNQANINLVSGGLHAHTPTSRKTRTDPGPETTSGTYALRDLLSIKTTINAGSGSVSGTPTHGSSTDLKSTSRSITADITPYEADTSSSTLRTFTRSGMMAMNLRSPYRNPGTVISSLTSSHKSNSGSIKLTYPQAWEGRIEGGTNSRSPRSKAHLV